MRRTGLALTLSLAALLVAGCSDPAADKPKASIEAAAPTPNKAPGAATASAGALRFNNANGEVKFMGSKVSGTRSGGTFAKFDGSFRADGETITDAQVTIDMTSVTTPKERLTKHLRSDDFFDVPNHPTATFVTTAIQPTSADPAATHKVSGNLTLRGVTKAISFPAKITKTDAGYALQAEFSFDRQPFGVAYTGSVDDLIRDDVVMTLDLSVPAGG